MKNKTYQPTSNTMIHYGYFKVSFHINITKTVWVKEKPKFFNYKTCLITNLKYSVSLFYNLFMYM